MSADGPLRAAGRLAASHPALVSTVVLFAGVAVKLMWEARYGVATLQVLTAVGDVPRIMILVAVSGGPILLAVVAVAVLAITLHDREFRRLRAIAIGVALLAAAAILLPIYLAAIMLAQVALMATIMGRKAREDDGHEDERVERRADHLLDEVGGELDGHFERWRSTIDLAEREAIWGEIKSELQRASDRLFDRSVRWQAVRAAGAFVPLAVALVVDAPMWLPAEDVELDDGRTVTAYVIGDEDGWARLVRVDDRTVETVRDSDIEGRRVCDDWQGADAWWARSPLTLMAATPATPLCDGDG